MDYAAEVGGDEFYADGQEDNAKEFAEDGDEGATQDFFETVDVAQHYVVYYYVGEECDEDVDVGILGTEGYDGGEGTGTGNEGEGNGYHRGAAAAAVVLEDFNSENHLECHDKEHDGTCHGKGLNVYTEEFECCIAKEKEDDEDEQGDERGIEGMVFVAAVFQGEEDGDGTRDVDDGKENQKCAYNLY